MKCTADASEDTSMSVNNCCSVKLKILTLVMTTADLINERATPTLGMSHAIIAPIAIFTTYFFIGVLVIASLREYYASYFLQLYALIACAVVQISLSIIVFKELRWNMPQEHQHLQAALVLNGVLPMLIIFIAIADLILVIFSHRVVLSPVLPSTT